MSVQNKPEKVLVIRFSSIGDIILTTPVFKFLGKKHPGSEIHFLTRNEFSDLIRNNPHINRIIPLDKKEGFSGLKSMKEKILHENYNYIYDLHGSLRSRYITLFPGKAKIRRIRKNYLKRLLLIRFKINLFKNNDERQKPLSVVEKYLSACGYRNTNPPLEDIQPEIHLEKSEIREAAAFWKKFAGNGLYLAVSPGARHFTKRWPPEYYAELAMLLYKKYKLKTAYVGGPEEKELIKDICSSADPGNKFTVNLAGKLSLTQTEAVISRCSLFISNDSALMHAASAFQRFQIAIFGSTVRELGFFPINPRSRILEKNMSCRPCSHIGRSECPEGHFNCMREIKPLQVLDEFTDCMWVLKKYLKKENGKKRK